MVLIAHLALLTSSIGWAAIGPAPQSLSTPARTARLPPIALKSSEPAPPEVIDAEAKATPNRIYRLAVAGGAAAISLVSAGATAATMTGALDSNDVLLFGNPYLTLGADLLVGGTGAWAFQQEMKTKEENIARIWEEVQRRRSGGAASGANRSQRRAKKVVQQQPAVPAPVGFASAPTKQPPPSPPPAEPATQATEAKGGGLLDGAKAFFDEANAMGKANALNLNAKLEDAGVLPPVAPPAAATGTDAAVGDNAAKAAAPSSPADPAGGGSKGASGKGKKKKKRSKKR
jgi:hypothetical protein